MKVLAFVILGFAGCSSETDVSSNQLTVKANAVDAASNQQLGISVNALSLLLDASAGTVYPANGANIQSREGALNELEKNGYVKVRRVDESGGGYLFVERTQQGELVARTLLE